MPAEIWISPSLPQDLRQALRLPEGSLLAAQPEGADYRLEIGDQNPVSLWVYVLAAPFPTVSDNMSQDELTSAWNGVPSPALSGKPLLMSAETYAALAARWGEAAPGAVEIKPPEEILDYAWEQRPAWAILPFDQLEPKWKVLSIDGMSPNHREFDPADYFLSLPVSLTTGDERLPAAPPEGMVIPPANRDPEKLTILAMTGVTALVRGTAWMMEHYGVEYPAQDIAATLSSADLTHISNEIPFTDDCPFPDIHQKDLVFCSHPSYISLMDEVGTDLVELTGDHFGDYGDEAMLSSLEMYRQRGWLTFGGGENASLARQPALVEHNGNKLAFLGCNIGCQVKTEIPCKALATEDHPGAAACDFPWLEGEIGRLRSEGYQVIVTIQHKEYFTYTAQPLLIEDFGRLAVAGATIVSGSQAHQPHGFAFEPGAFQHYGLGNLFFDQYNFCANGGCNNAFIDQHIFYDGRYISTELIPIRFVDMARVRLMTPEERARFLPIIFAASGW
jgi:poly-gamma-glutamate synthesis protein (capsule biosynthesis protein)